jgi:hypothetical protein
MPGVRPGAGSRCAVSGRPGLGTGATTAGLWCNAFGGCCGWGAAAGCCGEGNRPGGARAEVTELARPGGGHWVHGISAYLAG